MDIIYLSRSNYKRMLPINVVAISYYPQEPDVVKGPMTIVSEDRRIIRIQDLNKELTFNELNELIPLIQTFRLKNGRLEVPEDWKNMDLEDGGYLIIRKKLYPRFIKKINSLLDPNDKEPDWFVFDKNWITIILELLNK